MLTRKLLKGKHMKALTSYEETRYNLLDQTIKKTRKAFIACGKALIAMQEGRLYREHFKTFAAYVASRGFKPKSAYNLITAAKVSRGLGKHGTQGANVEDEADGQGLSERVLLALAKYPEKDRPAILEGARSRTGKGIHDAAARLSHKPLPQAPAAGDQGTALAVVVETGPIVDTDTAGFPAIDQASAQTIGLPEFTERIRELEYLANQTCGGDQQKRDYYGAVVNQCALRLLQPAATEPLSDT